MRRMRCNDLHLLARQMGTSTAKLLREKTMVSPTHPDIVEFMTLYEHIQSATKGKPDRIPFLYKNDPKFAELCRQIHHRVFVLNLVRDSGVTVLENGCRNLCAQMVQPDVRGKNTCEPWNTSPL
jgi:hypothetical protein